MPAHDIERLKQRIAGIRFEDNPALVRQKSVRALRHDPLGPTGLRVHHGRMA
jgi:hypothetical protein